LSAVIPAAFALFESKTIENRMTKEAPGEATIQLQPMQMRKRHYGADAAPLLVGAVTIGSSVALNVFSSWLYDKLKASKNRHVKINRRTVEVSPEGILKAIEETIEIEEK
jgi:hypothetical protein